MGLKYTIHDRVTPAPPAIQAANQTRAFGQDIKFSEDTEVTPAGRYVLVQGLPAFRQAVYHALITEPGSYRRFPDYGVGLLRFVGRELTPARVDEVKNRISEGLLKLRRVEAVRELAVLQLSAYALQVHVALLAAARTVRFQPFDFRRE